MRCIAAPLRTCSVVSFVHVLVSLQVAQLPLKVTACFTAASVVLLDKALFQATVGGGKRSVCSRSARARLVGSPHTAILPPPRWATDRRT